METSGSSNNERIFNSNIFSVIWRWKYRNHTICFLIGVILSSLFWLHMGGEDRKLAEKQLKEEKKKTAQLEKQLIKAETLREDKEEFVDGVEDIKNQTIKDRKKLYEKGNKDINSVYNSTHAERQRFITRWAEKWGDSLYLAE